MAALRRSRSVADLSNAPLFGLNIAGGFLDFRTAHFRIESNPGPPITDPSGHPSSDSNREPGAGALTGCAVAQFSATL
jgi:hypothetical protein